MWSKRLRRSRPHLIDAGLAVALTIGVMIAISVTEEEGSQSADTLAYLFGPAIGALVFARRRWPLGTLIATVVTLQVYYILNYPGILAAIPLSVALYSAAAAGHLRWAVIVATWYWVPPLIYASFGVLGPRAEVINEIVRDGAIMAAVLLLGDGVRTHRALLAEAAARLRRAAEDRRRDEREMAAARVIQQQLLPKELPCLPGWRVAVYYEPARAVGGDFYDFIALPDGQIAFISGDVTDKGIPAALVMATAQSILRGDAPGLIAPGAVLQRANERLFPDIPAHMFVTCLYVVLDPTSGRLRIANAGHNLPYLATAGGVVELRATGMPLGALPGMTYEEQDAYVAPGDTVLLHSDGLVEAHNPAGEMFGFPRLQRVVAGNHDSEQLIDECLAELRAFTGSGWEQEDDITLVTLTRIAAPSSANEG